MVSNIYRVTNESDRVRTRNHTCVTCRHTDVALSAPVPYELFLISLNRLHVKSGYYTGGIFVLRIFLQVERSQRSIRICFQTDYAIFEICAYDIYSCRYLSFTMLICNQPSVIAYTLFSFYIFLKMLSRILYPAV